MEQSRRIGLIGLIRPIRLISPMSQISRISLIRRYYNHVKLHPLGMTGMGVYFSFLNSTLAGIFCHLPFTANFSVLPSFLRYEYVPSRLTFSSAVKSSLP